MRQVSLPTASTALHRSPLLRTGRAAGLPPYGLRSSLERIVMSAAGERAAGFAAGREHSAASIVVVPVVPQDRILLKLERLVMSAVGERAASRLRVGRNHSVASRGRTASSTTRTPLSMCPPANRNSPAVDADTQDRASRRKHRVGHSPILRRWSSTSPRETHRDVCVRSVVRHAPVGHGRCAHCTCRIPSLG